MRITSKPRDGTRAPSVRSHSSRTRSGETRAERVERGRDRRPRLRLELELERGDEARRAQHAQAVLAEALLGAADRAQQLALQVGDAAERIDQPIGRAGRTPAR